MPPLTLPSLPDIRAHFPALARVHNGKPVAYFDGPGGTQVPQAVIQAMVDYLTHHNANTHWAYPSSVETDAIILEARRAMADLLGGAPEEVAFGANMTTLTFHLSRALGAGWGPGDEVVVTELDHHANVDPWRRMARERGMTVRTVRMDPATGRLDLDHLAQSVGPATRLVAVGLASNALGTVNPVSDIASVIQAQGSRADGSEVGGPAEKGRPLLFVDAVHAASHMFLDVQALGCDFLACSPYKFYGPHLGVMWGRRELLQGLDVPKLAPSPNDAAERLETGTLSHEAIAGVRAGVDFLASLSAGAGSPASSRRARLRHTMEALHHSGETLFRRLWEGLDAVPGVRLYGPPPGELRTTTLVFTVEGVHPREVCRLLAHDHAVFLSDGDFYATTAVDRLGLSHSGGLVRAGLACYTTEEEVDRLVAGVNEISREITT
ncbi:MAG: cysteine desulfurase-like protein [Gemmatimonadota bacterium]